MIRYIGISNHKLEIARKAMLSSDYDTIQFPFSMLSTDEEADFVRECKEHDIGFIAMKALSGGLITDAAAAFAGLWRFDNVVPIWGIQKEEELDMFITLEKDPPVMDENMQKIIDGYIQELAGEFCRGCGYCMPCPAGIPINIAARISLLLKRGRSADFLNESFKEKMLKINDCTQCGHCKECCPYGIDTPALLKKELDKYMQAFNSVKQNS
jgi:predicted aldo/keto reductase-like oxidoreductase